MHQDHFWNLLAKKLSGEASEEEIDELTILIKENPDLSYAAQNVADLWKVKPVENKGASEEAFQKLFATLERESKVASGLNKPNRMADAANSLPKKWHFALAFTILAAIAIVFFLTRNGSSEAVTAKITKQVQEILTRPGTRTKVALPDGTTVWLNAGSKLTYTLPFGSVDRSVTLAGEAYFDVVKNQKPFLIYTNGAQIKVLGTAFNVRSYPSEKKIETSLVHGRVEISLDNAPEDKFYLKPNQKLTLNIAPTTKTKNRRKKQIPIAVFSELNYLNETTIAETSWIQNKLAFEDESFEEVAKKMERWYGVWIEFRNEKVKAERLTGVFEKEPVWQALKALQEVADFHFTMKDNQITITN